VEVAVEVAAGYEFEYEATATRTFSTATGKRRQRVCSPGKLPMGRKIGFTVGIDFNTELSIRVIYRTLVEKENGLVLDKKIRRWHRIRTQA
jgi:hypothetical protein